MSLDGASGSEGSSAPRQIRSRCFFVLVKGYKCTCLPRWQAYASVCIFQRLDSENFISLQLDEALWDSKNKRQRTNTREITTHTSIHTLHLDGLRELYRHFLRLPDGAIVEVGQQFIVYLRIC